MHPHRTRDRETWRARAGTNSRLREQSTIHRDGWRYANQDLGTLYEPMELLVAAPSTALRRTPDDTYRAIQRAILLRHR